MQYYDTASWELVWLGIRLLILVTYSFNKENNSKHQQEIFILKEEITFWKDKYILKLEYDKDLSSSIAEKRKEEVLKQKEDFLLKERLSKMEIQLTQLRSKRWIVEDIDKYIIEKENKNE
ncbi:MAG TPA: hypothetical protein ENK66_04545 [Arcobacter sp.]|nr:hypothetical protein [Arcobacter sp.]